MIRRRKEKFRPILPKKTSLSTPQKGHEITETGQEVLSTTNADNLVDSFEDNVGKASSLLVSATPSETVQESTCNFVSEANLPVGQAAGDAVGSPKNSDKCSKSSIQDVTNVENLSVHDDKSQGVNFQKTSNDAETSNDVEVIEATAQVMSSKPDESDNKTSCADLTSQSCDFKTSLITELSQFSARTFTEKRSSEKEADCGRYSKKHCKNPPKIRRRKLMAVPNTQKAARLTNALDKPLLTDTSSDELKQSSPFINEHSDPNSLNERSGASNIKCMSKQVVANNDQVIETNVSAHHNTHQQEEVSGTSVSAMLRPITVLDNHGLPPLNDGFDTNHTPNQEPSFNRALKLSDTPAQTVSKHKPSKEKQSKQRAMEKLKLLQKRNTECENKAWPTLDPDLFSMCDLIYLNPPRSTGKELGLRAKLREVEEMAAQNAQVDSVVPCTSLLLNVLPAQSEENETQNTVDDEPALVPQLRVNEDGSVVLDEESLIVNSTPKTVETVDSSPAVYESGLTTKVNQYSFRKRPPTKTSRWTNRQTDKFFMALSIVGADFDLMSAMFRNRTRDELRRKYSVESKRNHLKVDHALKNQHLSKWTDEMFQPLSSEDEEKSTPTARKQKKKCHQEHSKNADALLTLKETTLPANCNSSSSMLSTACEQSV